MISPRVSIKAIITMDWKIVKSYRHYLPEISTGFTRENIWRFFDFVGINNRSVRGTIDVTLMFLKNLALQMHLHRVLIGPYCLGFALGSLKEFSNKMQESSLNNQKHTDKNQIKNALLPPIEREREKECKRERERATKRLTEREREQN